MFKLQAKIAFIILALTFLQGKLNASTDWTAGDYNIPGTEGASFGMLNTYNDVTVTMLGGGGVSGEFNMYDNSKLTMYDGYIDELNLYQNTAASLLGGYIQELWVDTTSTGWVKVYARNVQIEPFPDSHGYINVDGDWLDGSPFSINIRDGVNSITHIQFIPEPATLALLGLGGLSVLRRRRR